MIHVPATPAAAPSKTPRVSVIIPAFNAGSTIEAALASVSAQTLAELEILVIDDASTDDTTARVAAAAAADPRIRLLRQTANGGPSVARNRGISEARGDWLALLDSDDIYLPGRLESLVALAELRGVQMCSDNLALAIEGDAGPAEPMIPPVVLDGDRELGLAEFVQRNVADPVWPRLNLGFLKPIMKRQFILDHGIRYDERVRFAEDFALYVDCFAAGARWWMSAQATYRYSVRANSLTQVQTVHDLTILQRRLERLADTRDPELREMVQRQYAVVSRCLYYRNFTDLLKAGQIRAAAFELMGNWQRFSAIAHESARQAPIITRKAVQGGYRKQHNTRP